MYDSEIRYLVSFVNLNFKLINWYLRTPCYHTVVNMDSQYDDVDTHSFEEDSVVCLSPLET